MGIQTAASGSGGGVDGGEQPQMGNLARQGSVYGLTLNEVQNHLGEPLHSMNFDELLRSVLPAEVNEPIAVDLDTASSQYASSSGLQRQGSITMPRALSKKTVDEVWRDIQQGHLKGDVERSLGQERQPTLGEMTLEDFLVKAGVVVEGCVKDTSGLIGNISPVVSGPVIAAQDFAQGANWFQQYHQMTPMDPQQQEHQSMLGAYMPSRSIPQQLCVGTGPIMDAVYSEAQMSMSSPTLGTLSDPQTPGRKRATSGDMVERRQKRMIKNRESAARSRARKQAYTNELENKVSRLEEENEKLKKQKELDKILLSSPPQEPKYQLRRTSSAPF